MRMRWIVLFGLLLGLATAAGTTFVNRPFQGGLTGEMTCAKTDLNPYGLCYRSHPQGGFPLIHIRDNPDAANTGQLGLEDLILPISLVGNIAAATAVWVGIIGLISLLRPRRAAPVEAAPAIEGESNTEAPLPTTGLQIHLGAKRAEAPREEAAAAAEPSKPPT